MDDSTLDETTLNIVCMIHAYKRFLYCDDADVMERYRDVMECEEWLSDIDAEMCKIEAMAQVELAVND